MPVVSLLNFEGISGSNTFTDEAGLTWIDNNGSPVLSDLVFNDGSSSLLLNGSSSISTVLNIGAESLLTFEMWVRTDVNTTSIQTILSLPSDDIELIYNPYNNTIIVNKASVTVILGITPDLYDDWVHVALVLESGILKLYVNGVSDGLYFNITTEDFSNPIIGASNDNDNFWSGNIDTFRITKGEIVYGVNFPPPIDSLTLTPTQYLFGTSLFDKYFITESYSGGFSGSLILCDNNTNEVIIDPPVTSTNIVQGNVTKLGLPYRIKMVAVSLNDPPEILGSTFSDALTGDYSIDVYPHQDEVMLYAVPDYGKSFITSSFVSEGEIIHPTIPNKNVYLAQNDGLLGVTEPVWPGSGIITSNEVDLMTIPLHRPLMNGFIKPVVTPI